MKTPEEIKPTKHTPGPWRVVNKVRDWPMISASVGTIALTDTAGAMIGREEIQANAELISRAPDLWAENLALREAGDERPQNHTFNPILNMSIKSQAKHPKKPSPVSGTPRLFGHLTDYVKLDIGEFQKEAHKANQTPHKYYAPGRQPGAFGGATVAKRVRRFKAKYSTGYVKTEIAGGR